MSPPWLPFIGGVAGILCYGMMFVRVRKKCDESLDAWAIHGMEVSRFQPAFAAAAIGGISGLVEGNAWQFAVNTVCAVAALIFAFVMTYCIAFVIDRTLGMRVTEDEEYVGLDICQHGERA